MSRQPPAPAPVAIGIVTAIPGLFSFFCPSVLEVDNYDPGVVKLQQAKAGIAGLLLGAAGSWAVQAPWPFLLAIVIVAVVMWEYNNAPKKKDQD